MKTPETIYVPHGDQSHCHLLSSWRIRTDDTDIAYVRAEICYEYRQALQALVDSADLCQFGDRTACDRFDAQLSEAKALLARPETKPSITREEAMDLLHKYFLVRISLCSKSSECLYTEADYEAAFEACLAAMLGQTGIIKWYGEGMKISFHPSHDINTGERAINGMKVIEVPASDYKTVTEVPDWVSSRVAIGQEITVTNIRGEIHWYIDNLEVTEPQSPDQEQP